MSASHPEGWEAAFRLVQRMAALAASRMDPAGMARSALEALCEVVAADCASVYLVEGEELVRVAATGTACPTCVTGAERVPMAARAARLLAGGAGTVHQDRPDTTSGAGPEHDGLRVLASAVLASAGARIGLLHVGRLEERRFDARELSLIATAAAQLGPGLQAAMRQSSTDHEALASGRELSILQRASMMVGRTLDLGAVLEACFDVADELAGPSSCSIFLDDGTGRDLVLAAFRGPAGNAFERVPRAALQAMDLAAPDVIVDDAEKIAEPFRTVVRSHGIAMTVAVPLVTEGQLVGLFTLGFGPRQHLSRSTLNTLRAIGEQEAAAIDRARAHTLSNLRARLSDSVRRVAERALAATSSDEVFDAILDGVVEVTRAEMARISAIDDNGALYIVRGRGMSGALGNPAPIRAEDPALGWLRALTGPKVVREAVELPISSLHRRLFEQSHVRAMLVMPLRRSGRLIGALAAFTSEPRGWNAEEVNAFGLLASVSATAIDADRLRAEAEAERRRLGQIIDSLPIAVVVVNAQGIVEHTNHMVLANAPGALIGSSWELALAQLEMTTPDGKTRLSARDVPIPRALRSEEPPPMELRLRTPRGWRHIISHAVALRDDEGYVTGVVGIAQDVTALRELADSRDRFLHIATHELSNPLASLKAILDRINLDETALADPVKRRDFCERLRRQVERMTRQVSDLQDVERLRDGTLRLVPTPCDLSELARDSVESARAEKSKHTLRLEAPTPVVGVWDRVRILQVITNLLQNAMRYSPDGGDVHIRIDTRGDDAVVRVRDEGIGIPPAQLKHLFEYGYRTKEAGRLAPTGSGLGLYITHEIVRRHSGRIEVESEPGRGSTFTVLLPREALATTR